MPEILYWGTPPFTFNTKITTMIKFVLGLILSLSMTLCVAQSPSGCGSSNWASSITINQNQTFSVPSLSGATYRWVVSNSNLLIVSGQGTPTVTIKGNANGSAVLYVTRYKDGVSACADKKTITVSQKPNGTLCTASIASIWCNEYNSNGYNSIINTVVNVSNPFQNPAWVEASFNPAYLSGLQLAGGAYSISAGATTTIPSQFAINAQNNFPGGFYVPMRVRYTDLVTGQVCTVTLNPLVTSCGGGLGNQRLAAPGTVPSANDPSIEPVHIELYDLDGKKVMDQDIEGNLPILNSQHSGLHILHILYSDGSGRKEKIMLENR